MAAGIAMTTFMIEDRNGGYMIAFADMPISGNEPEQQLQMRLDGSRDGALGNVKGSLTKESRITLAGTFPGRDIEGTVPQMKGALHARIFIVGRRLYQLLVIGTPSWVNSSDATKFLDSFALTQ
jgi:hypothetical protein